MGSKSEKRLLYFDVAKALGMVAIILGHSVGTTPKFFLYTFHVPLFFIISGYFVNQKYSIKEFCRRRFRTLVVPYLACCVVIIVLSGIKGLVEGSGMNGFVIKLYAAFYGTGVIRLTPFRIPRIDAIWFLLGLFWSSVLLRITLEMNKKIRWLFLLALMVVSFVSAKYVWLPFSIQPGMFSAFFMYVGYLFGTYRGMLEQKYRKLICLSISMLIWISYILSVNYLEIAALSYTSSDLGVVFGVAGTVCGSFCVLFICKLISDKCGRVAEFISGFGRVSILVLIVHVLEFIYIPWDSLFGFVSDSDIRLIFICVSKILLDFSLAYLLNKVPFVRKVLGDRA